MSKTLLVYKDENFSDFYTALIKGYFDSDVIICDTAGQAIEILDSEPISLLLMDFSLSDAAPLLKHVLKRDQTIATIVTADNEDLNNAKKSFKTQTLLSYHCHTDDSDLLMKKAQRMLNLQNRSKTPKNYCKVNLSFFFSAKEVFCDVYIQLADKKFVKILNRYDKVDIADLKKFDRRNVKYLYVRERDFSLITKKLVQTLSPLQDQGAGTDLIQNDSLNMMFSIQLQETVSETIQKIGLNQEALEMTSIAINNTMGLVERNNEVYEILQKSIKHENYCSEHSFLLSYISCAILKESPYAGDAESLALTLAAFFHDVTIEEPDLAKIQTRDEYKFKTLGIKEQEEYLSHPTDALKVIEKIEGIPNDVFNIIENHHERYDGSGFPAGLNYRRLSPLCSIFNVSHELVLYLFDSGNEPSHVLSILNDMAAEYTLGHYATAIKAAQTVFSLEQEKLHSA